jgi:hypothetical protein
MTLLSALFIVIASTVAYWLALGDFVFFHTPYSLSPYFSDDLHAKVQVYSLSLIFKLWAHKHYRSASFQQDMLDNLRNVAVPGTGIPLSIFCYHKVIAMFFVFFLNPVICFFGAWNKALKNCQGRHEFWDCLSKYFVDNLLHPTDWFSLWRMNCRLVSYHSMVTKSSEYKMEDKWTFLVQGKDLGVPVSPFFDNFEAIVCKNKLIEGGMGIHFYRNAAFGGDWILQERLQNAPWLNALLPGNAPLSTMRIITTSTFSLSEDYPLKKGMSLIVASAIQQEMEDEGLSPDKDSLNINTTASVTVNYTNGQTARYTSNNTSNTTTEDSSFIARNLSFDHCEINDLRVSVEQSPSSRLSELNTTLNIDPEQVKKYIRAESAVLRLGRANASTDHSSILFDVDIDSGTIKGGTTNAHWYQLGLNKVPTTPWLPPYTNINRHLDAPFPEVAGKIVPNMQEAVDIVTR